MGIDPALISAEALHASLADTVVIDASWHMPAAGRDAYGEYLAGHIPGACFFDLDANSSHDTTLPHMLPDAASFASVMARLGVSDTASVVVYDTAGIFSAPRLWWMLRVFGHSRVRVLNGGLPAWKRSYPQALAQGEEVHSAGRFTAELRSELVATKEEVANAALQVCDARSFARFSGQEKDPRAGVRSGHIPGSRNLHYARLLTDEGMMRPAAELAAIFSESGIALGEPLVTSCGSGVTACILALALYETGYPDVPVYDGSWAEWGSEANAALPVEVSV